CVSASRETRIRASGGPPPAVSSGTNVHVFRRLFYEYAKVTPFLVKEAAMRGNAVAPVLGRRPGWVALGVLVVVLSAPALRAEQTTTAPAAQAAPVSNARLFAGDGGMVLNFIKPDKTADFEAVMAKVKEALAKSEKPERKQQAAGWKVFK